MVTVIVQIRHPRYTAICRMLASRVVRGLPAAWRCAAYWRLLELAHAAPRFVVLGGE
jgi:hypothetical protein